MVGDVYNQIMVLTATPDGALVVAGDKKFDLLDSPNVPGFMGYSKQLFEQRSVFGSEEAVKHYVESATTAYNPQYRVSFESFGRSYLKSLDIIGFVGIDSDPSRGGYVQPLRITNINTEIDPNKNTWWSKFDCEWINPGDGVDWAQ